MSVEHPQTVDDAVFGAALAAGTANIIMQLSRPGVGYGVVESPVDSGKATLHPVKRARTTFTYLSVALWGTDVERKVYRNAVNGSHAQVRSTESSPVEYNAFDPDLQLWVAACLYHGLEDVHHAMFPDSDFRGEHGIYEASHTLGSTLQVKADRWPVDRDAFETYWKEGLERVSIDDTVRRYLTGLTDMTFLPAPVRLAMAPLHRFNTIGFLSEEFRDEMHFTWSRQDQRRFDAMWRSVGLTNRVLPTPVRHFPYNAYLADFRRRVRRGLPLV
jgi:uncharacterized protein (DUF2236 family)